MTVLPAGAYTLDASGKTITLTEPYTTVTAEQIFSIRNLTKNMLIYDSNFPNHGEMTIEAGVITFSYCGTMEDTDKIQIVCDFVESGTVTINGLDGGTP